MTSYWTSAVLCLAALALEVRSQTVHIPFEKHGRTTSHHKRDTTYALVKNDLRVNSYLVNVSIGEPPQVVEAVLDTGSADLWVFAPGACNPHKISAGVCIGGSYDPRKSSTYSLISENGFSEQYGTPGSFVKGDFVTDTVSVGSLAAKKQQFAIAKSSAEVPQGILGIGFDENESVTATSGRTYSNFVSSLMSQGAVGSMTYSIYLDGPDENTGGILFGGYDRAKYQGDLIALPIQVDSRTGKFRTLSVVWTFAGVRDHTGTYSITKGKIFLPVTFDTGTTFLVVPEYDYNNILYVLGFDEVQNLGPVIECDRLKKSDNAMVFGFGGAEEAMIRVPFPFFATELTDPRTGRTLTDDYGNTLCGPTVDVSEQGGEILFGDTFLKAAYVLFDLGEKYIYIAQASYSSRSDVVAIGGKSSGQIASVTGFASAAVTATGLPGNGGFQSQLTQTALPSALSLSQHTYQPSGTVIGDASQASSAATSTSSGAGAAATGGVRVANLLWPAAIAVAAFAG